MSFDRKRYEEAKRLRESGLTFKAIGISLGVSGSRARQMYKSQLTYEHRCAMEAENPRPKAWHHGLSYSTVDELKRIGVNSKEECMILAADNLTILHRRVVLQNLRGDSSEELLLSTVNEVRIWLGISKYVPPTRVASPAQLERAKRLLERHGWRVVPPKI